MNHQRAIDGQLVEKYVLGELPADERDAFEEHYFTCAECAEEVRITAGLAQHVKDAFRSEERETVARPDREPIRMPRPLPARRLNWWNPALAGSMAASFLLLAVTGYQSAVRIPRLEGLVAELESPRSVPSAVLLAESRGEIPVIAVPKDQRAFTLTMDVNPADFTSASAARRYRVDLDSAVVASVLSFPVEAREDSLHLLIPVARLDSGQYTLRLRDEAGASEIAQYRFRLRKD